MNFTAKSRYALKIMIDLAEFDGQGIQKRHAIADRQRVPLDFMDQIMAKLRGSGLVTSVRGCCGGVKLSRPPHDISLWDIFHAVEDNLHPVSCLSQKSKCNLETDCSSSDAWANVYRSIKKVLSQKALSTVTTDWLNKKLQPTATFSTTNFSSQGVDYS